MSLHSSRLHGLIQVGLALALLAGAVPSSSQVKESPGRMNASSLTLGNAFVELEFDAAAGVYSARRRADGRVFIHASALRVGAWDSRQGFAFRGERHAVSDRLGEGERLRVEGTRAGAPVLLCDFTLYRDSGVLLVSAGLRNTTAAPIRLLELHPLWARGAEGGGIFVGPDPARNHRTLTGEGDFLCPTLSRRMDAESANLLTTTWLEAPHKETLILGGLSTFEFQQRVAVEYRPRQSLRKGGRRSLDGWVRVFDRAGKRINPGQEALADPVYVDFSTSDPYLALEAYASRVARAMDVRLANYGDYVPVCLWYVWAFSGGGRMANTSTGAVAEAERMRDSGMARYAPPLIRLVPDEYTNPNEQLWWDEPHWRKFVHLTEPYETLQKWTDGMKALGAFGDFYMQPTYRSDDYCEAFPDHMLDNDARRGPDYTDPGFIAHLRRVYGRLSAADVRGVFYDYSAQYMNVPGGFQDETATAVSAYRRLFGIAKEVMGPDFLITENPFTYGNGAEVATGVIDAKRSEDDKVTFTQPVVRRGTREWYRNRTTKLIDPDVKNFSTRDGDLLRAQVTGMAFMFGKLMLGSSIARYPAEVIPVIGRSLPMPLDVPTARPVGLFEGCDEEATPNPAVYHCPLAPDQHVLLFWNHSDRQAKPISARLGGEPAFGGLGLEETAEFDVWDFWDWRHVDRVKGSDTLTLSVRPTEMKTLMLRAVRPHPYLLSTNRHVLQGRVDAHHVTWDEATRTLSGAFDVIARDRYKAILKLPDSRWQVEEWTLERPDTMARQLRHDRQAAWIELSIDSPENARLAWSVKFALEEKAAAPAQRREEPAVSAPRAPMPHQITAARISHLEAADGDWSGRRGADGYLLASYHGDGEDVARLPGYVKSLSWGENVSGWVFSGQTRDRRALALPESETRRLGTAYARNTLDVYLDLADAAPRAVTLYCVDFDRRGRRQSLAVLDPGTLRPLTPELTLENFQEGVAVEVVVEGSAVLRLRNLEPQDGARNAVLAAIFFDAPQARPPQAFRLRAPQLGADRSYTLSWEPSPGADVYRLRVEDARGRRVVEESLSGASHVLKNLRAGRAYRWSVEAGNAEGAVANAGGPESFTARFPAPSRATWLGTDRDTRDTWSGVFGTAGYVRFASGQGQPADVLALPGFILSATAGGERVNWRDGERSGSYTCAFDRVTAQVTARDRRARRMTLAFSSGHGCNSGIELWDPHYNVLLCRAWVAAPRGETRYVSFRVAGDVRIELSRNRDCFPKNALLSGIFWDE